MGGLFSRTVVVDLTSQYSTELKQIDESIAEMQARKQSQLSRKRRITRALILYGSLSWLLLLLVLYVIDIPNRTHFVAKCLRVVPAVVWPLLLFLGKSAMDSYYTIQWKKMDTALTKLEKSKETKLEDLMARTNYKETAKLISQFSEKKKPQAQPQPQATPPKMGPNGQPMPGQQQQQQGGKPGQGFATPGQGSKTMPASAFAAAQMRQQQLQYQQQHQMMQQGAGGVGGQQQGGPQHLQFRPSESSPQAPAPVRTKLDKLLDFVLNDGPSNKYALICPGCYGHNGLVQEADLGKLRYKCAMCGRINGPPPPPQQQQQQMQQQGPPGPGGLQMSPLPPQTPAGKDAAGHMPLTPFASLSSPSREVRSQSLGSRTEVDPAHLMQREQALAEGGEDDESGEGAPAPASSRNSRANSRRGSERKETDDSAIAAARAAAAAGSGSDSDGGFEEVDADANAAPRKRKGGKK